jgi:hypothetical protein
MELVDLVEIVKVGEKVVVKVDEVEGLEETALSVQLDPGRETAVVQNLNVKIGLEEEIAVVTVVVIVVLEVETVIVVLAVEIVRGEEDLTETEIATEVVEEGLAMIDMKEEADLEAEVEEETIDLEVENVVV